MVINEKALVSAVKDAYAGGGYTVCYRHSGHYVVYCGYWAVEIEKNNIPRKLIGLISEHMGFLPDPGEAYRIMKTKDGPQVQTMIWETAIGPFVSLEDSWEDHSENPVRIVKTALTYDGYNVWQKTGNLGVLMVNPAYERIFYSRDNSYLVGNALYQEGAISKAFVFRRSCKEDDPHMVQLSGIRWTAQ